MTIMKEQENSITDSQENILRHWERPICEKLSISRTYTDPTCIDIGKSLGSAEALQITDNPPTCSS